MSKVQKACPVVFRMRDSGSEVLAFIHPSAGKQFVKGTIEPSETPLAAAERELWEESGLTALSPMALLGQCQIGPSRQLWHFFGCQAVGLPDTWQHLTADDHGHTFAFFWHPIDLPLDQDWHPIFHEAFNFFAPRLWP
ncbi:NUDIX domain-containing protein [Rhizobium sp. 11_C7_N12_5]|uniref:NUDIX domain-containing protein n=1 Tax=Rhizobium sp. 11_C7_N12_5 TaxID=3240770 RepID=UPI003F284C6F